jgi:hypothetical protein
MYLINHFSTKVKETLAVPLLIHGQLIGLSSREIYFAIEFFVLSFKQHLFLSHQLY